jgi:hypothetical protein
LLFDSQIKKALRGVKVEITNREYSRSYKVTAVTSQPTSQLMWVTTILLPPSLYEYTTYHRGLLPSLSLISAFLSGVCLFFFPADYCLIFVPIGLLLMTRKREYQLLNIIVRNIILRLRMWICLPFKLGVIQNLFICLWRLSHCYDSFYPFILCHHYDYLSSMFLKDFLCVTAL